MPLKAVLFDLDGTLIDSIPHHKKSFQNLFKKFGKDLPNRAIAQYIRWPTEEIYRRLHVKRVLGLDIEHFLELRRIEYYRLIRGKKIVFKNRIRLLKKIKNKHKLKLGLVTNSSLQTTKRSTPESALRCFDCVVTFSDVYRGKPAPDMLLKAARRLHAKPSECVMVGDSVIDVMAAKAAKMRSIGFSFPTAASTLTELRVEKPFAIVKNVRELEEMIGWLV